jgi:phosphoribosylanthranilate isomerase
VSRTRIKFCGMTRPGDVRLACELGVDAVGLVFAERSPRRLDLDQAMALRSALAPFVDIVALFMDAPAEQVERIVRSLRPQALQFHGDESEAECRRWGIPYLKAISMADRVDARSLVARYPSAAGLLLDSHAAGESGGSGRSFDWTRIPSDIGRPWLLAGGLRPENVGEAMGAVRPWGVDVSSGIESAPGVKDGEKMRRFVEEVRRAENAPAG